MDRETYAFALQNTLAEVKNVCPDIKTSFVFDKQAAIIAGDTDTPEATIKKAAKSLENLLEKSDTIGGLNSLVVEGSKGNLHISSIDEFYLTMVTSKKADMMYVETVGRVLIPTIIKLLNTLGPPPLRQLPPSHTLLKSRKAKEPPEITPEEMQEEDDEQVEEDLTPPQLELPSNQLIVESFGGLLVRSDTVHISEDIMSRWEETLDGKQINLVEIEAFNGQTSQCKVKTVDDSKLENKAVIRIPEKVCQTLDVKKGELVRVKPVIS